MVPLTEEMNAEKYRRAASCAIEELNLRGKLAIVVGGSGLYIKALTHGLAPLPSAEPNLREKLNAMGLHDLRSQLCELDPETARKIDLKNRRRLVRALEICLLSGKPASEVVAGVADSGWPGSLIPATTAGSESQIFKLSVSLTGTDSFLTESLILAQNERWRRG